MAPKVRDEGSVSEITILPDGRVYLFGLTRPLLDVLAALPARESGWQEFHRQVSDRTPAPADRPPEEARP
jgi:hypothetical protein